jgi:hypothetical protein
VGHEAHAEEIQMHTEILAKHPDVEENTSVI